MGAAGHRPANPLCAALPPRQRGHTQGLHILSGNEIDGNGKPFIVQHCHQYTRISNLRTSFCMKMAGSYLQILSWPKKRGGDLSITASDHLQMVCKIFMGITHTASYKGFTCVGADEVLAKGAVDEDEDITASVSVSGTRGFMAPEVRDIALLSLCVPYI